MLLVIALATALASTPGFAPAIAVDRDHFTIDRGDGTGPHAKFLTFISYFDGMRAVDRDGDLDYIANALHLDGIRVMANWWEYADATCPERRTDTLIDSRGNIRGDGTTLRGPALALKNLILAAGARGLIVDVTFTRETVANLSIDDYVKGVTRAAQLFVGQRNVLFDLQNEWEVNGLTQADVVRLRNAVHGVDPSRLVVASTGSERHTGGTSVQLGAVAKANLSAAAYHGDRDSRWETRVGADVDALRSSGKPVYLQEPQAWNSGLRICRAVEPTTKTADGTAAHFIAAITAARAHGGAAFTFHTRQSFVLKSTSLKTAIQSNAREKTLLEGDATHQSLSAAAAAGVWRIDAALAVHTSSSPN